MHAKLTFSTFTDDRGNKVPANTLIFNDAAKANEALERYTAAGASDAKLHPISAEGYAAERARRMPKA